MFLLSVLGMVVVLVVFALICMTANEWFPGAIVIAFAVLIYPAYLAMVWLANL